ncbi:MAG TPA: ERCC4 domain-containing protein [Candidatus Acidoferrum sp.]|nr:ERCC4 domain-containing protein [Candidatus Acidoferrum sp.]
MKLQSVNIKGDDLRPPAIPPGLVLVQDTREQQPLFRDMHLDGLPLVSATLSCGDYSLRGFEERFVVERKKVSDFYSYIGKERARTLQKMARFKEIAASGGFVGLVIEATEEDILSGFIMSRVSPEAARQALVSFELRYGVHIYYSRSRRDIARWVLDRAVKFYRIQREVAK